MSTAGFPPVFIERLSRDHARIADVVRELSTLADLLSGTSAPTEGIAHPTWERVGEFIEFLDYFGDRVHHPLEDRLFDHLVNKGISPAERPRVLRNLRQHQRIKSMTASLADSVSRALEGGVVDPGEFLEGVAEYIALQQRHMRFEESHLFPLLNQEFENRDWNQLMGILENVEPGSAGSETG